jgi:uncharacterized protein YggU (UPF0235/DUF167 family)
MVPGGVEVRVRVTPRGGRDAIDGLDTLSDGRAVVKVRVRALPEDGAANEAVRRLLAKALGRPAAAVSLAAGAGARVKTLGVAGDAAALTARLSGLAGREAA